MSTELKAKPGILGRIFRKTEAKDLVKAPKPSPEMNVQAITKEKITEWLTMTGKVKELNPGEVGQFLEIASAFGLNPFKREIHVSVYSKDDPSKRALTIVIGYEVYLKRAERINNLNGWKCWTEGEVPNLIAKIQIWRKDRTQPFEWEVPYSEAVQMKYGGGPNHFWSKMPKMMLKKVCISQGFRLCFPDDLGGIPYTDAEMGVGDYQEAKPEVKAVYPTKEDVEDAEIVQDMDQKLDGALNEPTVTEAPKPTTLSEAVAAASKAMNGARNKDFIGAIGAIFSKIRGDQSKLAIFTAWLNDPTKERSAAAIEELKSIVGL